MRNDDRPIADLLARVACGSERAFDELYAAMADQVFAVVRQKLVDSAQSEEVAQEVMLEVWQQASRFEAGRGNGVGWILTIARRRAIDRVRASQSSRIRDLEVGVKEQSVPHDDVAEQVELGFETERLRLALSNISPLQREALVATYLDGRKIADAAHHVGASESAVKTRMRDGLTMLRIELGVEAA